MIDVKEAARMAAEYFANLYEPKTYTGLQLEEVELTEDEKFWLITLSYQSNRLPVSPDHIATLLGMPAPSPSSGPRMYKQFKIDAETGKVHAMTIRKVS